MKTPIATANLVPLSLSLALVTIALVGCATPVQTPGGEVTCYSSRCVDDMRAWTQQDFLQRQYEQEQARRASAKTPAPPSRPKPTPAVVKASPTRQPPQQVPQQVPCPTGMIPNGPPEYGCIYPRR